MAFSAEYINSNAPLMLGAAALPIAWMTMSSMREEPSEEEKLELAQEKVKRAARVADNIEILEGLEKMEEEQNKMKSAKSPNDGSMGSLLSEQALDDEDSDMEEGTIKLDQHADKVKELASVNPEAKELEKGLVWCGKLALRELQIATTKTKAQKSHKYADGQLLADMLEYGGYRLRALDECTSHYSIPADILQQIRQAEREAWKVRNSQLWNGVFKGLKIIFQARECLPWVCASMSVAAARSYVGTTAQIYQASVMDAVVKGETKAFITNAKASVIVSIFSSMVEVLERQLSQKSNAKVSLSLSCRLCESILGKDMVFWREQGDSGGSMFSKLFGLPYEVREALTTPQQLLTRFVAIVTMAVELRRKSGGMYRILALLQIGQVVIRKGIDYINRHFSRYVQAKIFKPSRDQFSFFHAMQPRFAQIFQAFARTQKEVKSFKSYSKSNNKRDEMMGVVDAVMEPVNTIVSQGTRVVEYTTMKTLMQTDHVNFHEAQNLLSYAEQTASSLQIGYEEIKRINKVMDPLAAAYDLINIPPSIDLKAGIVPEQKAQGHFVFKNVQFRYPGKRGNALLLKDVSFEAKPGQVVGITGASGCGKSTTLRLVQRFYDTVGGSITLDGRDIKEYNPEWLRSQIVAVEQEPMLLPMTIRENLIFGCKTEPSREEIQKACEAAQIWTNLQDKNKFPEGLETRCFSLTSVAGGEKQRICIARAILVDPPILLLDEATSALDEVSQHKVQEALSTLMNGRTTLVVAHRLSTIKDSDKIIGMHDGVVVDEGTHDELLAKKDGEPNVWKTLWKTQGLEISGPAPPSLQRTTTTTAGKFAVLRSALASSLPKEQAKAILEIVNQLEAGGGSTDEFKTHLEHAGLRMSKWHKLRGAVLMSKMLTSPKTSEQSIIPELGRTSSTHSTVATDFTSLARSLSAVPTRS